MSAVFQAHNEYVMAEKKREEWELKNHREGEILEMVEIFEVRRPGMGDWCGVVCDINSGKWTFGGARRNIVVGRIRVSREDASTLGLVLGACGVNVAVPLTIMSRPTLSWITFSGPKMRCFRVVSPLRLVQVITEVRVFLIPWTLQ